MKFQIFAKKILKFEKIDRISWSAFFADLKYGYDLSVRNKLWKSNVCHKTLFIPSGIGYRKFTILGPTFYLFVSFTISIFHFWSLPLVDIFVLAPASCFFLSWATCVEPAGDATLVGILNTNSPTACAQLPFLGCNTPLNNVTQLDGIPSMYKDGLTVGDLCPCGTCGNVFCCWIQV